eukprot:244132-Chlamydomonas_euryale.AAC.12
MPAMQAQPLPPSPLLPCHPPATNDTGPIRLVRCYVGPAHLHQECARRAHQRSAHKRVARMLMHSVLRDEQRAHRAARHNRHVGADTHARDAAYERARAPAAQQPCAVSAQASGGRRL